MDDPNPLPAFKFCVSSLNASRLLNRPHIRFLILSSLTPLGLGNSWATISNTESARGNH